MHFPRSRATEMAFNGRRPIQCDRSDISAAAASTGDSRCAPRAGRAPREAEGHHERDGNCSRMPIAHCGLSNSKPAGNRLESNHSYIRPASEGRIVTVSRTYNDERAMLRAPREFPRNGPNHGNTAENVSDRSSDHKESGIPVVAGMPVAIRAVVWMFRRFRPRQWGSARRPEFRGSSSFDNPHSPHRRPRTGPTRAPFPHRSLRERCSPS